VIDVQGISDSFPLASRIGLSFDFALFVYMLGAANTPLELDYFVEETIAKRLKTGARREKYFRVSENFNRRKKKITKITKKKNNHKNINFEIISKNYEIWERKPDNLERRMSDLEGQGYRLEVFGMKKNRKSVCGPGFHATISPFRQGKWRKHLGPPNLLGSKFA